MPNKNCFTFYAQVRLSVQIYFRATVHLATLKFERRKNSKFQDWREIQKNKQLFLLPHQQSNRKKKSEVRWTSES